MVIAVPDWPSVRTERVRNFPIGWTWTLSKAGVTIEFRVVPGDRTSAAGAEDGVLTWRVNGEWRPVPVELSILAAAFLMENEAFRHPEGKGGNKPIEYIREAARHGLTAALDHLAADRRQRDSGALF